MEERYQVVAAVPTQMNFIRNAGVEKKSLTFVGIIGNPRNTNKYFGGEIWVFTSTLKSFILLAPFLHLPLDSSMPG